MSDESGGVVFLFVVGFLAYSYWFADEPYIVNVKESERNAFGESYALTKTGSGQVAVFHGFMDDYDVCEMARVRIQNEGGEYACLPVSMMAPVRPWWKFWGEAD